MRTNYEDNKKVLAFSIAVFSLTFIAKVKTNLVNASTADNVFVRGNTVLKTIVNKAFIYDKEGNNTIMHIQMYIKKQTSSN